jgi:hypothetical protein
MLTDDTTITAVMVTLPVLSCALAKYNEITANFKSEDDLELVFIVPDIVSQIPIAGPTQHMESISLEEAPAIDEHIKT